MLQPWGKLIHFESFQSLHSFENDRGCIPTLSIHDHYSDFEILEPELVKLFLYCDNNIS